MQVKAAIKRIVVPELQQHGFTISGDFGPTYGFRSKDNSMTVVLELEKFWPKKLRVFYRFRSDEPVRESPPALELKYFKPTFCHAQEGLSYQTQEELNSFLILLVEDTINIVIPYMQIMQKNYVASTYAMVQKLASMPRQRAERFSERHGLPIEPKKDMLRQLDSILDSMKKDIHCRKTEFYENEDDIIDMAAYFGELICKHEEVSSLWTWRNIYGTPLFGAGKTKFDPLRRVLMAWNFGSETTNASLQSYPISYQSES